MEAFDHALFAEKKTLLLEAQLADNKIEGFSCFDNTLCTPDTDITSETGSKPIEDIAFKYGRTDRSSEVKDGDRGVIFNDRLAQTSWDIHTFFPVRHLKKNTKLTLDSFTNGGWIDRMTAGAALQVFTDCEVELNKILAGIGSAGTGDLATVVILPGGDEFNAPAPSKSVETYLREARVSSGGGKCLFVCEDVWFSWLENPNLAENGLNQHSMTDEEMLGWLRARGFSHVVISGIKAQTSAPEQGLNRDYIHAGVCAVGQLGAIVRYALNGDGVQYHSAYDQLSLSDYVMARADVDYRLPYDESLVVFQNTLA